MVLVQTDGFLLSSTTVGGDKEVAWINTSSFLSAYLPLAGVGTNKITGLGDPTLIQVLKQTLLTFKAANCFYWSW